MYAVRLAAFCDFFAEKVTTKTTVEMQSVSLDFTAVTDLQPAAQYEWEADAITTLPWTQVAANTSCTDLVSHGILETYFWTSVYSLFIFLIVVGNVLTIFILLQNRTARANTMTVFLVSLLVARTCIALFVIPVKLMVLFPEDLLSSLMCKLCHTSALLSSTASVWSTAAVSLVTYIKLVHPRKLPGMRLALAWVVVIWALSAAYASRMVSFSDVLILTSEGTTMSTCTTPASYRGVSNCFLFVDAVFLFGLPFCGVLYCYVVVIKTARKRPLFFPTRDVRMGGARAPCMEIFAVSGTYSAVTTFRRSRQWYRGLEVASAHMLATIALLTICKALTYTWRLYMYWTEEPPDNAKALDRVIYLFSDATPWLNVCVFLYFRRDIRRGWRRICWCCRHERKSEEGEV